LKILEAMAAGVPVISTRLGAEGIAAEHKRQIILADSPAQMVEAVALLLKNPDFAKALGDSALTLVREQYDWSVLGRQLLGVYQSLLA
jgi:glycosyltransferase involved in cell wall biosynthesis